MQIIDRSYFNKQNYLHIPLSVVDPNSSPSNEGELDMMCVKIERDLLRNALGLELYNELNALTDVVGTRFEGLVKGEEYSGKVWEGLDNDYSLIAYRVFETFVNETDIRLSSNGATKVNAENAANKTPAYLIANSNNEFITKYQGEYLNEPIVRGNFIDWYGCDNDVYKSLYGYLMDKRDIFPEWDNLKFKVYDTKNSFGI